MRAARCEVQDFRASEWDSERGGVSPGTESLPSVSLGFTDLPDRGMQNIQTHSVQVCKDSVTENQDLALGDYRLSPGP